MDRVWKGVVDDPSLRNPDATAWWELGFRERDHYDEKVRETARALANGDGR